MIQQSTPFDCHWKSIESGMDVKFRSGYHMHVPTLSKSTKEVYRMHGTWHSPNTLHNMVQAQSFCIITWNPSPIDVHDTPVFALWKL